MDSEDFRRTRVYAASTLLVAAAVEVVIGAWTLSGLPGGPAAGGQFGLSGALTGSPFWLRAEEALPNLLQFAITALPVAAVLLVALAEGPAATARRVTLTAMAIQVVALALGVVGWVAILGKIGGWEQVSWAVEIAVAVAGLILTSGVLRLRRAVPLTRHRAGAAQR